MAGVATESGFDVVSSGQQLQLYQSGEELAEWRSSEQVESGSSVTSSPYWDSDEDEDGGPKTSELYGRYTWKIDKFSQINKRELRSNAFEIGGYKWYILIYPQGCDVCNYLSLFLCVANHDKLLPGWSHFAQFTIAVVNKDPKKSKYSDTLHRFWKKEHDWGWKKFMEISKVLDGFIDDDMLIIKAQVQVIRERADRPFRCLDCHYRRELIRVYLTNVEQICRRYVEDRRGKLGKLIEDKARWSSFCAFWLNMDQNSRRLMSREKTESILKIIVKNFFVEKEVTSTLVMDSLYSGLKALEGQNKGKKNKGKYLEADELPIPIVCIEKEMFILVDDVLLLLARAAMEPLPPKDEKGPQNRTKDGTASEEFNKDSIERDERRLTELGRRTIEIFVLAHIFSKIEVAYQEVVALKKQEELIREEEAEWLAESEQRTRREAADKEKKSKKKQKRNNRKGKDKGRDDKIGDIVQDKTTEQDGDTAERNDTVVEPETAFEKSDAVEDVSDVSDSVDCVLESPPLQSEDRCAISVNCDADTLNPPAESGSSGISEVSSVQNGIGGRSSSAVDDSSSTCSSDSVPSVVTSVLRQGNSSRQKKQNSPNRGLNQQRRPIIDLPEESSVSSGAAVDTRLPNVAPPISGTVGYPSQMVQSPRNRVINRTDQHAAKREELTDSKNTTEEVSRNPVAIIMSPPSPSKSSSLNVRPIVNTVVLKKLPVDKPKVDNAVQSSNSAENVAMKSKPVGNEIGVKREKVQAQEVPVSADSKTASINPIPVMSRPLSAPLDSGPRPTVSMVSRVQTAPVLTRSISAAGRLGLDPIASTIPSYVPQSYRNAIMGVSSSGSSSSSYYQNHPPISMAPSLSFGMTKHNNDMSPNGSVWLDSPQRDGHINLQADHESFDLSNRVQRTQAHLSSELPACTSGLQHHIVLDEFPHLAIINELLEDEHGIGAATGLNHPSYQNYSNAPRSLNRHHSFPSNPSTMHNMSLSESPNPSPCRYDRPTLSYCDDLFQHSYGAFPRSGELIPQSSPYVNGQIDGYISNQWQMPGSDLPFSGHSGDGGYYPYVQEYNNLNGTYFRPWNGY